MNESADPLTLHAYSEDGTTLVAESSAGVGTRAFTLSHAFDAGNCLLVLIRTLASGCPSGHTFSRQELYVRRVP